MAVQVLMRDLEKPAEKDLDMDIDWICQSFGFYEEIDKEKTASKIFKELINSMNEGDGVTSTELGQGSNVTRGAALNHLKKMMNTGLVVKEGNRYLLRCSSLRRTVKEIHRDIDRIFEDIDQIATEIDDRIGIKRR